MGCYRHGIMESSLDADGLDVVALVDTGPQLPEQVVDLVHLPVVEADYGVVQRLVVLLQVLNTPTPMNAIPTTTIL